MAKEERDSQTDRRQYILIVYLALGVVMIFTTLLLALTPETPTAAPVTQEATRTLNPIILTQQADYATIDPNEHRGGGVGGGSGQHSQATPAPTNEIASATPSGTDKP